MAAKATVCRADAALNNVMVLALSLRKLFSGLSESLEDDLRGEQFGQNDRLEFTRSVDQIEGHRGAVPAGELGGDKRITIRPVGAE